ncbi:MAG: hypothetical protein FWG75_08400, partial [Cystobacterineae bacterium]|nr:hypothetical protein [Cystobacterineae bacterium]
GITAFPRGFATLQLSWSLPEGYGYSGAQTATLAIRDGQAKARAIPIGSANIEAFNGYANTEEGLKQHYQLSQNVELPAPPAQQSNWRPIGNATAVFEGSFNGNHFGIFGLRIEAPQEDYQGLFGCTGSSAEIENLRLAEVQLNGNNRIGALVGLNRGTVQSSHAMGQVVGSGNNVGGLVGYNSNGTVQNSYATGSVRGGNNVGGLAGANIGEIHNSHATGSVSGDGDYIGGLVGINSYISNQPTLGRVHSSYATGNVVGNARVGGLVGANIGEIHNSHATGSVSGEGDYIGGLVGNNSYRSDPLTLGRVHSSYATGNVVGNERVGGLAGINYSIIESSYATGSVEGNDWVGGLLGRNYYSSASMEEAGVLRNSLALNPRVSCVRANVGRVTGENTASLLNNFAFSGMLNRANNTAWGTIGAGTIHGASRTAAALQTANGFPTVFSESPWTYIEGHLPGLLGEPVGMPIHLQP